MNLNKKPRKKYFGYLFSVDAIKYEINCEPDCRRPIHSEVKGNRKIDVYCHFGFTL